MHTIYVTYHLPLINYHHISEQAYITDINDEDTLQYGSDVELTCTFKGRPAPVAEWFFNGQLVNQENYRTVGYSSVLTVKDFQPNNVGVYQCRVSNCPCHSHTRSINLYGTGKINVCLVLFT